MNLQDIPRFAKQREIEQSIDKFSPDYMEASEILASIIGQLRRRYEDSLGTELEAAFNELFDQLNEADATRERAVDEMTLAKWHKEAQG